MWVRVRGHWRSLKVVPFESLGAVSYAPSIVTMPVSLAISEIFSVKEWRDLENQVRVRSRSLNKRTREDVYVGCWKILYPSMTEKNCCKIINMFVWNLQVKNLNEREIVSAIVPAVFCAVSLWIHSLGVSTCLTWRQFLAPPLLANFIKIHQYSCEAKEIRVFGTWRAEAMTRQTKYAQIRSLSNTFRF